jgi:hypothetical protein
MMVSPTAQATPFQGLFLDPAPDRDDLSSALSRFVDRAARQAKLTPSAQLLGERGLALPKTISRIEIVLHPGQPTELRVIGGAVAALAPEIGLDDPSDGCQGPTQSDQPSSGRELAGADGETCPDGIDPGAGGRPAIPSQAQIAPLTVEVAARLIFALYRPGDQVSLDGLTERMRTHGLGVRRQRLVEVLTKLAMRGVLELSVDGSRTLTSSWANAQEVLSRMAAEEDDDLDLEGEASDWGAELDNEGVQERGHDA